MTKTQWLGIATTSSAWPAATGLAQAPAVVLSGGMHEHGDAHQAPPDRQRRGDCLAQTWRPTAGANPRARAAKTSTCPGRERPGLSRLRVVCKRRRRNPNLLRGLYAATGSGWRPATQARSASAAGDGTGSQRSPLGPCGGRRLLACGYEVVAIDNRGCGRSSNPWRPWTTRTMAADAVAVLDELKIERAHVQGRRVHKLGACPHAAHAYSWMSPPSRSRRRTAAWCRGRSGITCGEGWGARSSSARCGRSRL